VDITEIREYIRNKYGAHYRAKFDNGRTQKIYVHDSRDYLIISTHVCEFTGNRQQKCMELNYNCHLINFCLGEGHLIDAEVTLLKGKLDPQELEILLNTLVSEADKWEFLLSKDHSDIY
jgi:hypothetical protein